MSTCSSSPADLLCAHVEQDVSGRQADGHAVDQQGAGVRDQGDTLHREQKHFVRADLKELFKTFLLH